MKNNYIYVVLVKALTGLGNFARLIGKYEYTHIAVCLDEKLDKFYTFSRKKHFSPFDCGYMIETLDCYAFGKNEEVKLKVFKIPVSSKNKEEIEKYISKIANDSKYIFNFFSMVTMPIFHGFRIYKSHNCMTFVSKILVLTNTVKMSKPYYKYYIKELDELLNDYLYNEDYYKKKKIETKGYMNRVSVTKNILYFIKLNSKLIYRMVIKGKYRNE